MKLSDRINQIEASGTVHFTQLIQQLRGQGRDIIDLAVGEPPYDTPAGGHCGHPTGPGCRQDKIQPGGGIAGIKIPPGAAI